MDLAQHLPASLPWRKVAVIAASLALVELVALIAIAAVQLAGRSTAARAKTPTAAARTHAAVVARRHVHVRPLAPPPSHPLRSRSHVSVLVLNGNGVAGAAATEAARLQGAGYRIGGAANALRHDYARSMVMYVPGYVREARRLGHDVGIRLVAPIDGIRPRTLRGSKLVVLLGN